MKSTFTSFARPRGALLLSRDSALNLYGEPGLAEMAELTRLAPPIDPQSLESNLDSLAEAEVLFTGWGCPRIDTQMLAAAPRLKAIFFAGGTIRSWITPAVWARGITVSSAYGANAVPVSEYTLAAILFSLKRGWHYLARQHRERIFPAPVIPSPGAYNSTVGIISLGAIGRLVCERLRPFDLKVIAYDPLTLPEDAAQLGVSLVGLEELFSRSDVVSLHAPHLPATEGLVTGALLERLRTGATFINTARGTVVREDELTAVLAQRPDLTAVLDVLLHEPPDPANLLLQLPNVVLTPHIAGALGPECQRLGRLMIEEFKRWQRSEPLQWQITPEQSLLLA